MDNSTDKSHDHGEILRILANRSKKSRSEIALGIGVAPESLSRLYKTKNITKKIRTAACAFFGVSIEVFESYIPLPDLNSEVLTVNEPDQPYLLIKDCLSLLERFDELHSEMVADRKRFEIERERLLSIIENLLKDKNTIQNA